MDRYNDKTDPVQRKTPLLAALERVKREIAMSEADYFKRPKTAVTVEVSTGAARSEECEACQRGECTDPDHLTPEEMEAVAGMD